jgi:acetyl-CoA C-acetyltransferase
VENGSVTAGNASSLNDGAAAVLLMSADKARELGCRCWAHCQRAVAGSIRRSWALARQRLRDGAGAGRLALDEVDLIEANEAFAVQALAVGQSGLGEQKVNVNGGAIALGHPSAPPAAGSSSPCCMKCSAGASAKGLPPSASAADRASP